RRKLNSVSLSNSTAIESLWEIPNCEFAHGHGGRGKYPDPSEPGNAFLCGYIQLTLFFYLKL
ncbi:MAG: hypothetical protein ACXAAI_02385, partial [Promethearchaeota archaeon]